MATTTQALARKLGKNLGGYFGEGIDIQSILVEIKTLAQSRGWTTDSIPVNDKGLVLHALKRSVHNPAFRIYISAGIHGDEPAGPLAVRELLQRNLWPDCADIWLCPCLNPTGFPLNTRESADHVDLNRDYRNPRSLEIRAHSSWLESQPDFDCCFCLHEDWEAHGFYVYELNPENRPSIATDIVVGAREACPIDHNTLIDGRDAKDGIIRPHLNPAERPDWPEALYLITRKTRLSYTLEAPSDFPLSIRVAALVSGATAGLTKICSRS